MPSGRRAATLIVRSGSRPVRTACSVRACPNSTAARAPIGPLDTHRLLTIDGFADRVDALLAALDAVTARLPAFGWSLFLLSVGLLLGGLLLGLIDPALPLGLPLLPQQVQSLPALVLLALGALLIA